MEAVFNIQPMPIWDWRVAADLFFGGMGVGAFLFALLADWRFGARQRPICQTAAVLSPVLVVVGILFLMAKLGQPFSFIYLFLSYQPSSAIWWGGWLQTVFLIGAVVYALWWRDDSKEAARKALGWALAPLALAVGAYHGFLLAAFEVRALWSTGATVTASLMGFITTGIAVTLLVHLVRSRLQGRLIGAELQVFLGELKELRNLLGLALVGQLLVFVAWWLLLLNGDAAAQAALAAANQAYGMAFWAFGIGLGLVLPLVVGVVTVLKAGSSAEAQWTGLWVSSALILVGGLVIRWAVVMGGQAAPLTMQLG